MPDPLHFIPNLSGVDIGTIEGAVGCGGRPGVCTVEVLVHIDLDADSGRWSYFYGLHEFGPQQTVVLHHACGTNAVPTLDSIP